MCTLRANKILPALIDSLVSSRSDGLLGGGVDETRGIGAMGLDLPEEIKLF